jgi:superfamily II DNA or RNA helicase
MNRDPNTGYYGRHLWLPKKHINVISAKAGLEFPVMGDEGVEYLQLWKDTETHLRVPREFVRRSIYPNIGFPIVRTGPASYPHVEFKEHITLDYNNHDKTIQRDAFASFMKADCGILNLACGRGKTVISLKHMAAVKTPALVVVNNTTLIDQWAAKIKEFMEVQGGVGIVQGPPSTWDWKGRGIVLAMLHSLALRYEELPKGFSKYFGNIYFDEVHHLSAEVFSRVCPMFYGRRYGLSATPAREDGLELVYQYHVGPIFHKYLLQELKPKIRFQQSPVKLNILDPDVKLAISDKNGKICLPKLRSYLGLMEENNKYIANEIKRALAKGRKILVLSHSVHQLRILHDMFPGSGICTGSEDPADRLLDLRTCQVTFGTLQLVREGLDEDTLDTMFFITPFGSTDIADGGKNTLQQGIGRILRVRPGKKQPIAVIFDHMYIQKLHKQCGKLKSLLQDWPEDEGGPFEFETIAPYKEAV